MSESPANFRAPEPRSSTDTKGAGRDNTDHLLRSADGASDDNRAKLVDLDSRIRVQGRDLAGANSFLDALDKQGTKFVLAQADGKAEQKKTESAASRTDDTSKDSKAILEQLKRTHQAISGTYRQPVNPELLKPKPPAAAPTDAKVPTPPTPGGTQGPNGERIIVITPPKIEPKPNQPSKPDVGLEKRQKNIEKHYDFDDALKAKKIADKYKLPLVVFISKGGDSEGEDEEDDRPGPGRRPNINAKEIKDCKYMKEKVFPGLEDKEWGKAVFLHIDAEDAGRKLQGVAQRLGVPVVQNGRAPHITVFDTAGKIVPGGDLRKRLTEKEVTDLINKAAQRNQ